MTHKLTATKHSKCQDWVHPSIPIITALIYSTSPSNLIIWAGLKWLLAFVLQLGYVFARHRLCHLIYQKGVGQVIDGAWSKEVIKQHTKTQSAVSYLLLTEPHLFLDCHCHCSPESYLLSPRMVSPAVTVRTVWEKQNWNTDTNTLHYYILGNQTLSKA